MHFETHHNEVNYVLSVTESNVNVKMGKIFHICCQGWLPPIPHLTISLTITRSFFTTPINKSDENFVHKGVVPRSRTIKLNSVVFIIEKC